MKGKFGGYGIPKRIVLEEAPIGVGNGMLTQTSKLERRKGLERCASEVEAAFARKCSARTGGGPGADD